MAVPLARPVSLKNESIDVIRNFVPDAVLGPIARETIKGSVAHLKPPADSVNRVERAGATAMDSFFPKFEAGAKASLVPYPDPGCDCIAFADHAFNYSQYGDNGFEIMVRLG